MIPEEKLRINRLVGSVRVIGNSSRLPVVKIKPSDYSNKSVIAEICGDKRKVSLIICHGKTHGWRSYFPGNFNSVIFLDLNPVAHPDLLGDMRDIKFMRQFPAERFDCVILCYLPPPSPFHINNLRIFENIVRIIKPGGKLECNYMMKMYQRTLGEKKGYTKKMIEDKVKFHASNYFSRVKFIRSTAIMIK